MKIEKLETIWIDAQPNTMWLRIHTDDGLVGLGETFYAPRAVAAIFLAAQRYMIRGVVLSGIKG